MSFGKCEKNVDSHKSFKDDKLQDINLPWRFADNETENNRYYEDSASKLRENQRERFVICGDFDIQFKTFANKMSLVKSLNYKKHLEKGESLNYKCEEVDKDKIPIMHQDLSYGNVWLPSYSGMLRDPDLVDFPDFRSSSKVAIPRVQIPGEM